MTTIVTYFRKSLFFRLLAIFGVTVVLFIVIIYVSLQAINEENDGIESIPDYFTRNVESIIEDIGTPPNLNNAMRLASELDWTINISNPIMQWSSETHNRLDLDTAIFTEKLSNDAELHSIDGEDIIRVKRGGYDFYMYRRVTNSNNLFVMYIGVAIAIGILFANYLMVNRMLDPVRLLRRGAERIQKGDLSYRVKTDRQDELGELTESINHMADSLQSMLEAKRQLLMAISHELRTPLTKAKVRMELMPNSAEKSQLKEDIDEIDLLISDLLEAERLNNEHAVLNTDLVNFAEYIRDVVKPFSEYEGGLKIEIDNVDRKFSIDKLRIRLLVTNLINNAIRHGRNNPIEVKVNIADDRGIVQVIDKGEGIPKEHLAQISEPFYRADSSRQRNTGGFGLGLYLCRLITQAHGGNMIIKSELGQGTNITVELPRLIPT